MNKSISLIAALVFALCGAAFAADVCDEPVVSTAIDSPDCAIPGSGETVVSGTVVVPGPNNTTLTYGVPVPGPGQRVEWIEESYKDFEPRLETVREELRTRIVPKTYNVVKSKTVTDTHIVKVASHTGRTQRLVRGKSQREKEYLQRETLQVKEDYMHPIQETVYHEVDKVRRVPALVTK